MEIKQDRPAYVTFERRAVEDRQATLETGHYVAKDVDYALITPMGSKDRIERIVVEWMENLEQQAKEQRIPFEWIRAYKEAYAAWKEDRTIPENGYSIMNWAAASPSQIKQLLDIRVRTVEDLAVANEETIARLGMGGRALKQRAVDFLSSMDASKVSGEMEKLRQENESLKVRNESIEAQLLELNAKVALLSGEGPRKL